MTVLLFLLMISVLFGCKEWQQHERVRLSRRARAPAIPDLYVHGNGLLTMADGGQKLEDKDSTTTQRTKVGKLIRKLLHKAKMP